MADEAGRPPGLLAPYCVLDLSDASGFLCGKILADLGADVIKVEPPGGDPARELEPFPTHRAQEKLGLYWQSYNTNKRGITLDLKTTRGQELFGRLVRSADFVIETCAPGRSAELGLDFATLRRLNPRLVLISITPFGQSGPYRNYTGSDLIAMAMSGMMSLIGRPGQPPLRVSLPQAPMWAGMYAAAGGLIAHYHRELRGAGQQVDISLQSALLWALANAPAFWATNKTSPRRAGTVVTGRSLTGATMRAIYPCQDGHINFIIYGGAAGRRSNEALVEWLTEEGLATDSLSNKDWNRFDIATSTQAEIDELENPTLELFRRIRKAEFLEQGFKREMLGYPVANAADILADPHLQARGFWQTLDSPALGRTLKFPGGFARFSEAGAGVRRFEQISEFLSAPSADAARPAPGVGEHNVEIYSGELGLTEAELAELQRDEVI